MAFHWNCSGCHGKDSKTRFGGTVADLRFSTMRTHEEWNDIVIRGTRKEKGMPGFGSRMDAEESEAIRAYILSLSNQLRESR